MSSIGLLLFGIAALIAVAVIIGIGIAATQRRQDPVARQRVQEELDAARAESGPAISEATVDPLAARPPESTGTSEVQRSGGTHAARPLEDPLEGNRDA